MLDAEDSLVTVKVTTFKLVFLGNCWLPQQGAGTFNRLLAVASKRFLPQYFSKQI